MPMLLLRRVRRCGGRGDGRLGQHLAGEAAGCDGLDEDAAGADGLGGHFDAFGFALFVALLGFRRGRGRGLAAAGHLG